MKIEAVREALADPSTRLVAVTGAGLSRAAGLPTYRGDDGKYTTGTIPLRAADATSRNLPALWERLRDILDAMRHAEPTAGHVALAQRPGTTVVTQNIDGLHHAAGGRVLAMHGSLHQARCIAPGARHLYEAPTGPNPDTSDGLWRCTVDGARLRPDIVLFEEHLDIETLMAAYAAAESADVVLAVGTSLQVHPVAGIVTTALHEGAIGAWLDLDPARALAEVDSADRLSFSRLAQSPGDVQVTLPGLLNRATVSAALAGPEQPSSPDR